MCANENVAMKEVQGIASVPTPRCTMTVRGANAGDTPFIDALQKMHSHMVGFLPTKQLEKHIEEGNVVIATDEKANSLGYCIAKDHYMSRDDVGIVYQLNVMPIRQRHLIGATLIKEVFMRAAYGCRLFCCWCAQDIQANYFWESIGFVPLAFRTGSRAKQRIHIYWQRRVREHDEATPYWFPAQTSNGAVAEDRIVLPIPPGTHWRDAKPVVLPGEQAGVGELPLTLPGGAPVRTRKDDGRPRVSAAHKMAIVRSQSKVLQGLPVGKAAVVTGGGLRYVDRGDYVPEEAEVKTKKPRLPRAKHDRKHVAAARELRDRYLEQVNSGKLMLGVNEEGELMMRYEVGRLLPAENGGVVQRVEALQLPAA